MEQFIYFYLLKIPNIANRQQFNLNQEQFLDSTAFMMLTCQEVVNKTIIQIKLGEATRNFILGIGARTSIKGSLYEKLTLKKWYKRSINNPMLFFR